ncbi:MAG: flagellar biosynthesis anti-sigma factor FlgM [Gammaproteobacteria bacterium]|nr:flagellar biosynthesis anti-sigma factor FlgM [Gammaproteobacteria bacterium]
MNINKLTTGVGGGTQSRSTEKAAAAGQSTKQAPETKASGAQVKLSSEAKSIQQIEAEVAKMPDIDDAAVERIKGALANNEYKIDYERIAGQMIKFDKLLK